MKIRGVQTLDYETPPPPPSNSVKAYIWYYGICDVTGEGYYGIQSTESLELRRDFTIEDHSRERDPEYVIGLIIQDFEAYSGCEIKDCKREIPFGFQETRMWKCTLHKPKRRIIEWRGDYESARSAYELGNYDSDKAEDIATQMLDSYLNQEDDFRVGPSLSSSDTLEYLLNSDANIKALSDFEAKVLFIASSEIFFTKFLQAEVQ